MQPEKAFKLPEGHVGIMDAIYRRRAVRSYMPERLDEATIHTLLYASVQAPTALHGEPWAFAILQDKALLNRLSEDAKQRVRREASDSDSSEARHALDYVNRPDFNVFYNASTLIVIYGKLTGPFVAADCWLAAQNLMLAAYASGLGTCVIGFAASTLNAPEWKKDLGIPEEYVAYAPIIVGKPGGYTPPTLRKPPDVLTWRKYV